MYLNKLSFLIVLVVSLTAQSALRVVYSCVGANGQYKLEVESCSTDKSVHRYSKMVQVQIDDRKFYEAIGWNSSAYVTPFENNKSSDCASNYCAIVVLESKTILKLTAWENDEMAELYTTEAQCAPLQLVSVPESICIKAE